MTTEAKTLVMQALTISQPWADKIRNNEKFIENRTWSTPYRGPLLIHAGLGTQYLSKRELVKYDTGCGVAIAELVACLRLRHLQAFRGDPDELIEGTRYTVADVLRHEYTEGPFLWVLQDIRSIRPIKLTGKQGLWRVELSPAAVVLQ